ncbi:MAG TPA: hypothetical protein VNC50_19260 [Planctomycetia bacterium]|nr:hypothetical protein [Planctomycetia bacterium]
MKIDCFRLYGVWGKLTLFFIASLLAIVASIWIADWQTEREIAANREWLLERARPADARKEGSPIAGDCDGAAPFSKAAAFAEKLVARLGALDLPAAVDPFLPDPQQHPARRAAYFDAAARSPEYESWLEEADRAPRCSSLIRSDEPGFPDPNGTATYYHELALAETFRCRAELGRADPVAAARRALRLARLSLKHGSTEPSSWLTLNSMNMRGPAYREINAVLRAGPIPLTLRREIDEALALEENSPALHARGLAHDAAGFPERFRRDSSGRTWPFRKVDSLDVAFILSLERASVDLTDASYQTVLDLCARYRTELPSARLTGSPAGRIVGFECTHQTIRRALAWARSMGILNALQANGDLTIPLDRLGLPPAVLLDPFDHAPLRRKFSAVGVSIYSVDRDLKDGGGAHDLYQDIGSFPVSSLVSPPAKGKSP